MARGTDWSHEEVEACVADYLHMLTLELNGQRYSKTDHARALAERLDGRNRATIEFKHCNISAVLLALGYPYIDGYKPRGNYQALLFDVMESQAQSNDALQAAAQSAVLRPAVTIVREDTDTVWVPAPAAARVRETPPSYLPRFSPAQRDSSHKKYRTLHGRERFFQVAETGGLLQSLVRNAVEYIATPWTMPSRRPRPNSLRIFRKRCMHDSVSAGVQHRMRVLRVGTDQ